MIKYFPLILGMGLVTFLPRVIPLFLLSKREISGSLKEFLLYIPFTSLTILIVRGILTAGEDMKIPTVLGIISAGLLSYKKDSLVLSVLFGIGVAFISIQVLN